MAKVLLGTCDEVIATDSVLDWSTSKIGGKPNWTSPWVHVPLCPLCAGCRLLVTQLYCPLEASPFHRTLYVFACVSQQCWNKNESWFVLRAQKLDPNYQKQPSEPSVAMATDTSLDTVGMATSDWCTDADDWDDDDVAIATTEPVNTTTADATSIVCSGDAIDRQQSDTVSMVTETNCVMKSAGIDVPRLDECGVMEATSGGEKENELTNAARQMQCLQLGDNSECGKKDCGEGMEQGDCVIADDSVLHLVTDSVLARLVGPQSPLTPSTPCHLDTQNDVMLSHGEQQFTSYYVSVIEEPEKEDAQLKHERHLLAEYSTKEGVNLDALADAYQSEPVGRGRKGKSAGRGEGYEKGLARHGDEVFQKFTKRVSLCPQQLLRYSHGGSEVYITKPRSTITVPHCSQCGAERVFELQLMPSLVTLLSQDLPIEFGTVLVYTCSRSCWETETASVREDERASVREDERASVREDERASVREEYIYVQPDPDQHLFKCLPKETG